MRSRANQGPLSVHAIAGSYVVLLGINMDEASTEGVLGFAIERIDHEQKRRDWSRASRPFPPPRYPTLYYKAGQRGSCSYGSKGTEHPEASAWPRSRLGNHPIQSGLQSKGAENTARPCSLSSADRIEIVNRGESVMA